MLPDFQKSKSQWPFKSKICQIIPQTPTFPHKNTKTININFRKVIYKPLFNPFHNNSIHGQKIATQRNLNVIWGVPRAFKPPTLKMLSFNQKFLFSHLHCIAAQTHDIQDGKTRHKKYMIIEISKKLKTERNKNEKKKFNDLKKSTRLIRIDG